MQRVRKELLECLESKIQPLCRHVKSELPEKVGFAIILFSFDGPEACYGSNAERADMIKTLRELADTMEAKQDTVHEGN